MMEKELKDAFTGIKNLIKSENEHQNKSFTDFKKHHDEISKQYWKTVSNHEKVLQGTGAKGGLVACVQRLKEFCGINRKIIWFVLVAILGIAVIIIRKEFLG